MSVSRKVEVERLQNEKPEFSDTGVLHILNGQAMYEAFKENKLMGDSDYAPFNEAMCVNTTTEQVFDHKFIKTRASGHHETAESYIKKVIDPLDDLFNSPYKCIILWFGEDMFCQINLLTILVYLEQSGYEHRVILNSFNEEVFKVSQTELTLGSYFSIYKDVLINHRKPSKALTPEMDQAIDIYLDMLQENNAVVKYIAKNKDLPTTELLNRLFDRFPAIGYGDSQYIELINKTR